MGIQRGTRHSIGVTHREVLAWSRSAQSGEEFRAGKGLYLRRTEDGLIWVSRYVSPVTGKQVRIRLWADDAQGVISFPAASLEEATARAARVRADVLAGRDPVLEAARQQEEQRQAQQAKDAANEQQNRPLTFRELFDRWQAVELVPHSRADGSRTGRKDGGEWVRRSFERRLFPALGETAAMEVRRTELLAVLDLCKAEGRRRTANVLLTDLKQMFRFAAEREIVARNPLDGIKRATVGGKDVERDRVLSDEELHVLWRAVPCAGLTRSASAAIWLLLSTATRVGELLTAEWRHVDLRARQWYLPQTKNQRDHLIHLSDFAIEQFRSLGDQAAIEASGDRSPWVFPNREGTGPIDIKALGKQLADRQRGAADRHINRTTKTDSLALAGGRWTAHDLRRTAATMMAKLGIPTDVIDECLNHKLQSRVARVYIRDRRLSQQTEAFDALGLRLRELFAPSADIVGLSMAPKRAISRLRIPSGGDSARYAEIETAAPAV